MSANEFYNKIVSEITEAKKQERRGVFKINEQVGDESVEFLKKHLKQDFPTCSLEAKKCQACTNRWDILIFF